MTYLININGFKRSFKVYVIGSNVELDDPFSLIAFLQRHYATFSPSMERKVMRREYSYNKL